MTRGYCAHKRETRSNRRGGCIIEFEKRGIPATTIITQAFTNAAVFQFRAKGMDGHPYIELPHPISNLKRAGMREVTLRHVDQLVKRLTAQGKGAARGPAK